jgi:hypothetical protein
MHGSQFSRQEKEEFADFRRWLFSLNQTELLSAMEFSFQPSMENSGSHEYDILVEMVKLESPPPTPVHPRAMGYRPRSQLGPQLEYGEETLRRTQPRLFQWSERQSSRPIRARKGGKPQSRFNVIARKKMAPWGEVYSIGCTNDQREADQRIVERTSLRRGARQPVASFHDSGSARSIIQMLQVASRGSFLQPFGKPLIPFCAPWLQPMERWISLSFYLASRYHVSLWDSFSTRSNLEKSNTVNYETEILERAIPAAMGMGLRQAMEEDKQRLDFIRDSLVWNVLFSSHNVFNSRDTDEDWQSVWKSVTHTPLLKIHNPISQLQLLVSRSLDHTIVMEMEKAILVDPTESSPPGRHQAKKKKKKPKKRRRGGVENVSTGEDREENESPNVEKESQDPAALSLNFPNNQTSPRDRNGNIITVLTILEEIVESVFVEVGLEPTPPFEANDVNQHDRNAKQKGSTRDVRRSNPIVNGNKIKGVRPPQKRDLGERVGKEDVDLNSETDVPFMLSKTQGLQEHQISVASTYGAFRCDESLSHTKDPARPQWPHLGPSSFDQNTDAGAFLPNGSSSQNGLPTDFYQPTTADAFAFGKPADDESLDGLPFVNRYQARERSILTEFFRSQEERIDYDEKLMVASTAASISSSTCKDATILTEADEIEKGPNEDPAFAVDMSTINEDEKNSSRKSNLVVEDDSDRDIASTCGSDQSSSHLVEITDATRIDADPNENRNMTDSAWNYEGEAIEETQTMASPCSTPEYRSPSPQSPMTPPPILSPILVSLADLRELRKMSLTPERIVRNKEAPKKSRSYSAAAGGPGSLPNSPVSSHKNGLTPSWSREDLRIASFRDDQSIKHRRPQPQRSSDLQQTYRSVAVKSLAKPIASSKGSSLDFRSHVLESSLKRDHKRESCAMSETDIEGQREDHHWHTDIRRPTQDEIVTKDETTTITSALSCREPEEIASIREERNSYRDMCLTLGAEVAKLKTMLAAQKTTAVVAPIDYHPVYRPGSFDPNGMPPFFHGMQRGQRLGAMSDAGQNRGDHESQVSEDEAYEVLSKARVDVVRRMSSSATAAGSDVSVEFNNSGTALQGGPIGVMPAYDSVPVHGLQSRLTKDILRFLNAQSSQLKKTHSKRRMAIERFSRLVNTLWPRAQVKLYGSHVSGLCLPSSDLDFVICLPAVHKNAPALAPGVLEGRNAINETSQKLLARELKGESWIDPRSIKVIERTVVPVIKVSTKDTRARMIQLDISFDSPEHHGLEANEMVAQILEELPLIRPLMLVLKQHLLDRGLLTAYTGGLSSYCLFLMVARYLQEQHASYGGDCGSLLMGFVDFYGNHFDPRATGISVRRRQYFTRSNHATGSYQAAGQPLWTPPLQQHVNSTASPSSAGQHDYLRRNSFSDTGGSVDGGRRNQRPPRFQSGTRFVPHNVPHTNDANNAYHGHGRPFTFDPLFVEDPLSSTNNVGRNAFRIFQVQRAFSDAHRALVASLEWDIHSTGELNDGGEYALLKCLLQSEDVVYEL